MTMIQDVVSARTDIGAVVCAAAKSHRRLAVTGWHFSRKMFFGKAANGVAVIAGTNFGFVAVRTTTMKNVTFFAN